MDPILITAIMFSSMLLLMALGFPIAFCLGGVGVASGLILWGPNALDLLYFASMDVMRNWVLIAVPLFIFMGYVLHESGIAKDLFDAIYLWAGGIKGGLGMGTIGICSVMAAMVGISGAATLSMGVIALPAMFKRNYDRRISIGLIQAGGALGFLIPPSMMMIMYGFLCNVSVGQLFAGGILPGIILAFMYIMYIGIRCRLHPELGPPLPPEDRGSLKDKLLALRVLILPGILIFVVMGSIFAGVTSPTEASAIGAIGALVCAAVRKKLNWSLIKNTVIPTIELSGFNAWIIIGAIVFSKVYTGLGAKAMINAYIVGLDVNPWIILIIMQISFIMLGMFLDDIAILFLCMPIYIPIVQSLGFHPVWFGVLYIINMQMAFLTPPYGLNLFYMKAVAPPGVTMGDIYRSVVPFVGMQAIVLIIMMIFPQIVLYLPSLIFS